LKTGISVGAHKSDKTKFLLILEILVQSKKEKEHISFPYFVKIKGRGTFAFSGKVSFREVDRILRTNGAAILYGMFRGQVNQITAQGLHGQFLLPVANFVEMYERSVNNSAKKSKTQKKTSAKNQKDSKK